MAQARLVLDRDFTLGAVDPRLYGNFVEHMGRCVYTGIYEPDHPQADEDGFRADVLALVRELGVPVTRYPGGNFVSGYDWEDGVGPRAERPRRLDLAWQAVETNDVGTDEFIAWCRKAQTEPMLAVNLGTRGADAARNLVEYCNHPGGSKYSDLRRRHGCPEPHDVKLWCLGNEMDGPWQIGAKTPAEYGRLAAETAKVMKWVDPSIELVACGSSNGGMPTFASWEAEVLEHTFEHVEYLSLHMYLGTHRDSDPASHLAQTILMGRFIEETVACCDFVAAKKKSRKRLMLSFDEWNTHLLHSVPRPEPWQVAPPLQEGDYTLQEALVVGGMLIELLNHADRVRVACLAQLVNMMAPIRTEAGGPAWRQSIFYPLQQASRYGRGQALRPVLQTPHHDCPFGDGIPTLSAAATHDPASGGVVLFALHRDLDAPLELAADLRAFPALRLAEHLVLTGDDLQARNTRQAPDCVLPQRREGAALEGGRLQVRLPAPSWNVLRLVPAEG